MSTNGNKVALKSAPITPGLRFACALFDFLPRVPEELKLTIGDVVKILHKVDDSWLQGLNLHNGNTGQFPHDFVKDILIPKHTSEETLLYALDSFYPEAKADLPFVKGDIIVLERKLNNEWGSGRSGFGSQGMFPLNYTERLMPLTIASLANDSENSASNLSRKTMPQNSSQPQELGKAIALMKLKAQLDEELSFSVGDEIIIVEALDNGSWYKGILGSESGTFPASFVKLLAPLKGSTQSIARPVTKLQPNRSNREEWKSENVGRTSDNLTNNNNFASDIIEKKRTINLSDQKKSEESDVGQEYRYAKDVMPKIFSGATEPSTVTKREQPSSVKNILYTVKAMHKFTANSKQELSFESDVLIPIYEEMDDHWLMGKVGENEGYVPRSYVTLDTETSEHEIASKLIINDAEKVNEKVCSGEPNKNFKNTSYVKITGSKLLTRHHVYSGPQSQDDRHSNTIKSSFQKAVVVHDYQAKNKFDLSVLVGDPVLILRDVDENWCEMKNDSGQKCIVPSSYIELVTDIEPVSMQSSVQKYNDDVVENGADVRGSTVVSNSSVNAKSILSKEKYHYSSSVMPSVPEQSTVVDPQKRCNRPLMFSSPKPFIAQKPTGLIIRPGNLPVNKSGHQNGRSYTLHKSVSVDSAATADHLPLFRINRSNSNPKDTRVQLKAWQQSRRLSSPSTPPNERSIQAGSSSSNNGYETPIAINPNFNRAASRSASMKEKRSPRTFAFGGEIERDTNFVKIKSDSDLTVDAVIGKQRPRDFSLKTKQSLNVTKRDRAAAHGSMSSRPWNRDSISTASTGSSSSFTDSRTSHSTTQSDLSETPKIFARPSRSITRSAPLVPRHIYDRDSTPEMISNSPQQSSPWSPPVPQRKQSLQHETRGRGDVLDDSRSPEIPLNPRPGTVTPSRPAPKLPPSRATSQSSILSPQKKVAPMRPANPPRASNASGQERVHSITSRQMKERMEKLRSDIEDYSRMKRDLENLYQGTLDGKERREISENLEFVKSNVRRLQKEFHSIIEGQQDHIYESIGIQMTHPSIITVQEDKESIYASLPAPPLPPVMDSPSSIRKKRKERKHLVASELIKTERDFLIDVTVTVEDIMDELDDRQIPQQTITTLFGNIVQIKDFSEKFLGELEEALKTESSPVSNPEDLTIGQVFIDNILDMKEVYMPYCRNHDDAIALVEKLESDVEFMQAVTCCLDIIRNKVNNVIDLGSFLIKPVQRFLKYPLLINELVKLTDPPCDANSQESSDHDKLILAAKMMQSIAKDINEDKRTKDLVRKYKNASNEGLSEKLQKLSMKSLKKKQGRISRKIGQATGITTHETKDAQFDKVERRFKIMERAVKLFVTNITTYGDKCQEVLCAEFAVAKLMVELVGLPEQSHPVAQYLTMANQMSGPLYRQFHDQVQLQVLTPVKSLITSFKGPQTIITKRMDKLIDYERLQKSSDSKEKIQAARHDYEALNKSLLDELPKLCELGLKLISTCSAIFARVHRNFETKLLNALKPLLTAILQLQDGDTKIPSNLETYDKFKPVYTEAVQNIAKLRVVPASFGALFGSTNTRNSTDAQRKSRTSQSQIPIQQESPIVAKNKQSSETRKALQQKYQNLHVAESDYSAVELMDIGCCEGDLIAVLKRQDPMGNKNRWFVNKGGSGASTGFLPASILRPYDPDRDDSFTSIGNSSPIPVPRTPVPVPRSKSPTPSSRSASSGDSSGAPGGTKARLSPFQLRATLKQGTLPLKDDGTTLQLTDPDVLQAFDEEDEIFDDTEYEVLTSPGTSPRPAKQHFRAEYDFNARSELELSLRIGLIVTLINPHDIDGNPEWWYVSNSDGKQGFVPSNYLTKAEYL